MKLIMIHGAGGSSLTFYYIKRYFGPQADAPDLPVGTRATFPPDSGALPVAPHGGQLVRAEPGYLEFVSKIERGKKVFFLFPYDEQLAGVIAAMTEAKATVVMAGASQSMNPFLDKGGELFFYLYPQQFTADEQQLTAVAIVKSKTYTGSFSLDH
ncbi:MAG: hypothetical protein HY692_06530 [Cyanobacteria bacterium NC_groundwater_1444_Ag_S-0.65um_54_12]|nr:hypothetical protein [Cyanobacteria bacterium NC_groundwater_1444_Ag_S-0.65um_54_12]